MNDFFDKKRCDRCGADFSRTASTMSKFNYDAICMDCKRDERDAPGYARADSAECDAVRRGARNFPGVGLSADDHAFLAERRRARKEAP